MRAKQVVFTEPNKVELQDFDFDTQNLAPDEVAIKTHYSLISPGTELACLSGTEAWARLPFVPGYAGCGEIIATGKDVDDFMSGDTVFAYTRHASHVKANRLLAHVPPGLDEKKASFARMAAVSITALRVSQAELGDHVAVLGLGLVGNLCAQLLSLAGCEVIGIDLLPRRCELTKRCDVKHVINAAEQDAAQRVVEITQGRKCEVVVEATGSPGVAEKAAKLAGRLGEVILLGSPRQQHIGDLTALLRTIHMWNSGCITFKGAHEWRYPVKRDAQDKVKHSIERNVEILLRLIAQGRLHVEELITHVLPPRECMRAYRGLQEEKDQFLGVLFDWTKTG